MLTIDKLIPQGRGLAPVLIRRAAVVTLDWDTRQKSRFDATDSLGRQLGVFLPRGTAVRGGDVLVAQDGSLIAVQAAAQPVLRVQPCAQHGSAFDLVRAAYHLGNRHVQLELAPDHLKLEPDHVLADMLRQMHLTVIAAEEPFEPEGGAYGSGHSHSHSHSHAPAATHAHAHDHATHPHGDAASPDAAQATAPRKSIGIQPAGQHVHGPGCNHDHAHTAHSHGPAHGEPGHVHGPGCGHRH